MDIKSQVWGIWGYGIGGRALVQFLHVRGAPVVVYDKKELSASDKLFLSTHGIALCASLEDFFARSTCIVPSAGVDLKSHTSVLPKIVCELDFFARFFKKPIIAITGTLGKTTVTTLVARMLERAGLRVTVGGNIGVGLCSLIDQQDHVDYAVIEVSSFQLEYTTYFAPEVAVWTNFFPNHLDRHATQEEYFVAKAQLIKRQAGSACSIVPHEFLEQIKAHALYQHDWLTIESEIPDDIASFIVCQPGIAANWYVVALVLRSLKINLEILKEPYACAIEHRVELVRVINGRSFYNDSKATVAQATLAALARFKSQNLILLLGGLSKGVNREPLVQTIAHKVKMVICFGAEAQQLALWCVQNSISHKTASQLDEAVKMGYTHSEPGDVILLSPAGSSFDLFNNYQERGAIFKQLVHAL